MQEIKFNYKKTALVNSLNLKKVGLSLDPEITHMNKTAKTGYSDPRASINLPIDKDIPTKTLITKKLKLKPDYIVVIGIGGSNLGTVAAIEAIYGKLHNQTEHKIKFLFADTVDSDSVSDIISIITPPLKKGKSVLLNVVTKSGTTTETIANFQVLYNLLRKYKKNPGEYVVVTTDKNSKFWHLAKKQGLDVLEIPKIVGGRYSVFSAVGLFPLGMMGVNIGQLLGGAKSMRKKCLSPFKNNPAALSAAINYIHYRAGRNISDLFLFSTDLESIGKWYRQLFAESLGKQYNLEGHSVFEGITPVVSIGSTDLHSMAQLYLGGPQDKIATFVRLQNNKSKIKVPKIEPYNSLVDKIQNVPFCDLMTAILDGVQIAYKKGKRPFMELVLPDKSPFSIGQFFQLKMMEVMYLGYLMNVNPFDQPNVESYKVETKKILSRK